MADAKLRQRIAQLAASMMYERVESEYFTAKRKAAKQLGLDPRGRPGDLPSNREIRDHIQSLARLYEGDQRFINLRDMRRAALRLMRMLERFHPHLIGSVLTGHIRKGSDIDLHLFADNVSSIEQTLDDAGLAYEVERKRVRKQGENHVYTHVHVPGRFNFELTIYAADKVNYPFRSSITGKTIERASAGELERLIETEHPGTDLDEDSESMGSPAHRFDIYRLLLLPLENIKQNPAYHPEGDALYHSLQVFQLARDTRPWDEEFILAALLHDVGKAIDRSDHVAAGLEALEGAITPRTEFLIAHHMEAHAHRAGELGGRATRRLQESEDFEDLLLLSELDKRGRQRGVQVCSVDEALEFIERMPEQYA